MFVTLFLYSKCPQPFYLLKALSNLLLKRLFKLTHELLRELLSITNNLLPHEKLCQSSVRFYIGVNMALTQP